MLRIDPTYTAPYDFTPPKKIRKLYIPENHKFNFVGLILGPNGETQRRLQKESNCAISIRGKDSNFHTYDRAYKDNDEKLHVFIQADTEEDLKRGVEMVSPLLDVDSEEFKRQKEKQSIMTLNSYGFIKEYGCDICGASGHRNYNCPEKLSFNHERANVQCKYCRDKSHPSIDCPFKESYIVNRNRKHAERRERN